QSADGSDGRLPARGAADFAADARCRERVGAAGHASQPGDAAQRAAGGFQHDSDPAARRRERAGRSPAESTGRRLQPDPAVRVYSALRADSDRRFRHAGGSPVSVHPVLASHAVTSKARVVSGMRPTGRLHLGHLIGALGNWVPLQEKYDCFYFVANWHALTSDFADTTQLTSYTYENVADWIGAGLDPETSTFFVRSLVPEHAELYVLLSMVVPVPCLERVPTYKEQQDTVKDKDLSSIGFLGYPLLQTADVAMYDARFVPVGEDQVAHLERA